MRFHYVFTAFDDWVKATQFARHIVKRRLAACVNLIGPVTSIYWWKGKIEEDREFIAIAKSSEEKLDELLREIRDVHDYELPEVAVVDAAGSEEYVRWLLMETSREENSPPGA